MKRAYIITRDGRRVGASVAEGPIEAIDLRLQTGMDRDGYCPPGPYVAFISDTPYSQGVDAGLDGLPLDMNPNPRDMHVNSDFQRWREGWVEGNLERTGRRVMAGHVGG